MSNADARASRPTPAKRGVSLAKGPVGILGIAAVAFGVLGFIVGGRSFALDFPSGSGGSPVGEPFIGVVGNGWTWVAFAGAGVLLLVGAPAHWGAKSMAFIVGIAVLVSGVIGLIDGDDVLGVLAVNTATALIDVVAGIVLLVLSRAPRVGGKSKPGRAPDRLREGEGEAERTETRGRRERGRDERETASADPRA